MSNNISLSPEQKYALEKFKQGENIFITGPGGTGKTKLIQHFVQYAESAGKNYQVCALTGCAALLLKCKARTVHSWSGMKLARGDKYTIIKNICRNKTAVSAWRKTHILIVDEVSMMCEKIFDVLEETARITKRSSRPFGGMQVIFTGDFFQLPPVPTPGEPETEAFCFESSKWLSVFPIKNHIQLTTLFRQTDPLYIKILMEIRNGHISEENKQILQKYVKREYKPEENSGIIPTKLFPIRSKVEHVNKTMFEKIGEQSYDFNCVVNTSLDLYMDTGKPFPPEVVEKCSNMTDFEKEREIEYIMNNMPAAKSLSLKKGCIVMCTYNIDVENGICNGSQGIIMDIVERNNIKIPIVKFYNGHIVSMIPQYWQSDDFPCIAISQIPLCLSWALTIHKIQGSTMSMAEMDIGHSVFEYGQVYVALSRIQSLDGLYLINFYPQKIKANPKVVEFYKNIPIIDLCSDYIQELEQEEYEKEEEKEEEKEQEKHFIKVVKLGSEKPKDELLQQPKEELLQQPKDELISQNDNKSFEQPKEELISQNDNKSFEQPKEEIMNQPKNKGKSWKKEDDELLFSLHKQGISTKELAAKFDRLENAIRSRIKHLHDPEHKAYQRLQSINA